MTFDVKRLRPLASMKNLMLHDIHHLQGLARQSTWDNKLWRDVPGIEILPVVFGAYVACSLFGLENGTDTLDILYDLKAQAVKIPAKWQSADMTTERVRTEIKSDANHLGVPAFLNLHGVYHVPERKDIINGKMTEILPRHTVRLFTTAKEVKVPQLLGALELNILQIVQTPDMAQYSSGFRLDAEAARVNVAHADKLKSKARRAAEGRAKDMAEVLGTTWKANFVSTKNARVPA